MSKIQRAARQFVASGAELLVGADCRLAPDGRLSFKSRGCRFRFPAIGLAVAVWEASGGPGEWGIRLVGWGGWREIDGIFLVGGEEWQEMRLVEEVAKNGCVRRSKGRGNAHGWVEGVDVVSSGLKEVMGWEEGPGMLGVLHDLACKVDRAVWELSGRTTRVVCFGKEGEEAYKREISERDCEVVSSAQHIDLVAAWALCQRLLQSTERILLLVDPNDGPLPAQLGAPFLDYERLGCGWSPDAKSFVPAPCPAPLAAIACGFLVAEQGVLHTQFARLTDLPPPQGARIFFTTLSPPYLKQSQQIQKLVAWAPSAKVVKTPLEGAHGTRRPTTGAPHDVCCVFLGVRRPNLRFALYRLRAMFSQVVVLHTTAGSTQIKGSYWDGTFY